MHNAFNSEAERLGWPLRCDPSLEFIAPELKSAHAVWREKAGTRSWPDRAEMTPRLMKNFLPHLSIFNVVQSDGQLRFQSRITGAALACIFGSDQGRFLDEVVPSPSLERWQAVTIRATVRSFILGALAPPVCVLRSSAS